MRAEPALRGGSWLARAARAMDARHESTATEPLSLQLAGTAGAVAAPKLPISVMLVWMCALAGLALYAASWYVPGLAELAK